MKLTSKEWEQFFALLDNIVNADGDWTLKAAEVRIQAEANKSEMTLSEFIGWFDGDYEAGA